MAKDPAFLFYPSDFITGTLMMTMEERGQYITILCLLHQHGGFLPKDRLEFVVGEIGDTLMVKFLVNEKGEVYNKRLIDETTKRQAFCASRRENIQKRYKKPTYVDTSELHMENVNRDINEDIKDKSIKKLYGEYKHVRLTDKELSSLKDKLGSKTDFWIKELDEGIEIKGYKYKNHYLAILKWVNRENKQGGMADVIKKLDSRKTTEV